MGISEQINAGGGTSMKVMERQGQRDQETRLQDTLLVMDVVDELRHRAAELDKLSANDDAQLKSRLVEIYRQQGIEVSEAIVEAGIRAQREKRYAYVAPSGFKAQLAMAWINRRKIAMGSSIVVGVLTAMAVLYQVAIAMPHERAVERQIAELNSAMVGLPGQVKTIQASLGKALAEVQAARVDALGSDHADRLKAIVETQTAKAKAGESEVLQQLAKLDAPALAALDRSSFDLRGQQVEKRVKADQALVGLAGQGVESVRGAAGTIRSGVSVSAQLEAANQQVVALALSPERDAVRASLYSTGTAAIAAAQLPQAQVAAGSLSGLTKVFGEMTVMRQRADALLASGKKTGPDVQGSAALTRAYDDLLQALDRVDPTQGAKALAVANAREGELGQIVNSLSGEYTYRVVNREGVKSGVWRYNTQPPNTKNYYVVIEPIDASGQPARVSVRNEETGRTETAALFALRVSEAQYERVKADKMDNGLVDDDVVGRKLRGSLEPKFSIDVAGGFITQW